MTKINIADVQALIAYSILNNKQDVMKVMNTYGYAVSNNISDEDLFFKVWDVYKTKGLNELKKILSQVKIDKSKMTEEEARAFAVKFNQANPLAKQGGWLDQAGQWFGDLLGGTTTVVQGTTLVTQQTVSALPAWVVPTTAIIGIAVIAFLFSKGIKNALAVSIVIGLIIVGVMLYGAFAKTTTLSQTGGGGTQEVHGGILTSFSNWLNNVSVSIVGGG